ncbi:hypothetical protein DBL06_23580 [Agrobacterium pusense]|nr:hypothetical protein DBL06_23580 [Agrobacterium pusense]
MACVPAPTLSLWLPSHFAPVRRPSKTDIKDPNQNINWVPPQGGEGPAYANM